MASLTIKMTRAQWKALVPIVRAGERLEDRLDLPIELDNGDQYIEITADETTIKLEA